VTIETPHGPARAHVHEAPAARGALVLGHGAGGGIHAPDLQAVTSAAVAAGVTTVLVEQPYRVAGRRSAAPAHHLDAAWIAVLEALAFEVPVIAGGRSSGARVACRTAAQTGVAGVLCLAFPLQPPGDRPSRQPELAGVPVPVLVVQGRNDRFGVPKRGRNRKVVVVEGDHGLKKQLDVVAREVVSWLDRVLAAARS
jgi:predicted alpha/beta-hydrolase family hydrolase